MMSTEDRASVSKAVRAIWAMEPGAAMDVLVGERVMGLTRDPMHDGWAWRLPERGLFGRTSGKLWLSPEGFTPSTREHCAMAVLLAKSLTIIPTKMEDGQIWWSTSLHFQRGHRRRVRGKEIQSDPWIAAWHEVQPDQEAVSSLPLAICRDALLACLP